MPSIMPIEVYESLRGRFHEVKTMALVGCGEPTTDKRLLNFVKEANQSGVYVMFTTNGMFLDEQYGQQILASGLKLLGVSLDGATPVTYGMIRSGGSFEHVTRNLEHFMEIRNRNGKRPVVKVQIVLMRANIHELPALVELAAGWGVEEVYAKNLCFLRTHEHVSESLQEEYNRDVDVAQRDAHISSALHKAEECRLRLVLPSFRREGPNDCPYHPGQAIFVRRNGDVYPCPVYAVWNYGITREAIREKRMGNVLKTPLEMIWENEKFRLFRQSFMNGEEPLCIGCTVWRQGYQQYSPVDIRTYTY